LRSGSRLNRCRAARSNCAPPLWKLAVGTAPQAPWTISVGTAPQAPWSIAVGIVPRPGRLDDAAATLDTCRRAADAAPADPTPWAALL
jgi:hypothetical protein